MALMSDELHQPASVWELVDLQVVCGTMGMPTATVQMKGPDGIQRIGVGVGTGEELLLLGLVMSVVVERTCVRAALRLHASIISSR